MASRKRRPGTSAPHIVLLLALQLFNLLSGREQLVGECAAPVYLLIFLVYLERVLCAVQIGVFPGYHRFGLE